MIGGIAAELHGAKIARSLDLDVTPDASRANRERIARALAELNATLRVPGGMPDGVEVHIDADWLERVTTATFNTDHGTVRPRIPPRWNRRLRRSGALPGDRPPQGNPSRPKPIKSDPGIVSTRVDQCATRTVRTRRQQANRHDSPKATSCPVDLSAVEGRIQPRPGSKCNGVLVTFRLGTNAPCP